MVETVVQMEDLLFQAVSYCSCIHLNNLIVSLL